MTVYAVIDTNTTFVINMIEWDGIVPNGYEGEEFAHLLIIPSDVAWLDWTYVDGVFYPPPPVYVDPRPELLAALEQIDKDSLRALRIIVTADPVVGVDTPEKAQLEALEVQAAAIRAQLAALDEE